MNEATVCRVPLVILEEHHEAFYAWVYAQRRGWIPTRPNTLLHVDAHADMWLPRLRQPLRPAECLTDLAGFVYNELDIGSFIWPAAYLGIFNHIFWLRDRHRLSAGGWREIVIACKAPGSVEFCLLSGDETAQGSLDRDRKLVRYCPLTTAEQLKTDQAIVLDIDLDYFCCNRYPDMPLKDIEITLDTFLDFRTNPYHFLRLLPGDKVSAVSRNGKYYLLYNDYRPGPPPDDAVLRDEASGKLNDLLGYLKSNSIAPVLIVICRSYWSGYTPQRVVDDLQSQVVQGLSELYPTQLFTIAEILPPGVLREGLRRPENYSSLDGDIFPQSPSPASCPEQPS